MKARLLSVSLAVTAAGLGPAWANQNSQQPANDLADRIISVPNPNSYRVDGVRNARVRADPGVQFGRALRVPVPGRNDQAWTVAVAVPITRPVAAGDRLILAFWARLEEGENGATSAELPYNSVQLATAPYTALFHGGVTITPRWQLFQIRGNADRAYGADTLNVSLHLATGRQTVDIGPVIVLDMGQPAAAAH
jgi:hypothetical protein